MAGTFLTLSPWAATKRTCDCESLPCLFQKSRKHEEDGTNNPSIILPCLLMFGLGEGGRLCISGHGKGALMMNEIHEHIITNKFHKNWKVSLLWSSASVLQGCEGPCTIY